MRSLPFGFGWLSLLTLCSLAACGSSHDDLAKHLASVQTDLTRLQNHSDRLEERLEALEMRKGVPIAPAAAAAATPTVEHPPLMVVKLEPGDDTRDAQTDAPSADLRPEDSVTDKSPRPVIRVHGSQSDGDVKMASDQDSADSPRRKR